MVAHDTDMLSDSVQTCKLMIMTSTINHAETVDFFKSNNYFGAREESFMFFPQAMLPAIDDKTGKILMKSKCEMQLSPNGNGALFEAINTNVDVQKCIEEVDLVQVIGVDNVLNRLLDPVQVYFTASKQLETSLKCLVKRSPDEKVGVVCKKNNKYDIVEYSELSDE